MTNGNLHPESEGLKLGLLFTAFAAILLGLKLWLIHSYGNEVPYWDQWDAEAARLYQPFLSGDLSWRDLFAAHNEHRIFTTRLLGLLLLRGNGLWSPLLEMVVNAGLHVAALGTTAWLMSRAASRYSLPALLFFTLLLFGIPFGWENTLAGFQAQFYFVLLFSALSIWWLVTSAALSRWWWAGVMSAIAAYFSLASGVFALAAGVATLLLRFVLVSRDKRELAGTVLLLVLFLAGVSATPVLEQHAQLKAVDAQHFFRALSFVLAWPFQLLPEGMKATKEWPSFKEWLIVVARNFPLILLVCKILWSRPSSRDPVWFLLALGFWFVGQAAAIAYGRSGDALTSRYLDLHAMGILVNFASIAAICAGLRQKWRWVAVAAGAVWLFFAVSTFVDEAELELPKALAGKRDLTLQQEANVRSYVAKRDDEHFRALPFLMLPYPDAGRLAELLNTPQIRSILPQNLQSPLQPEAVAQAPGTPFERGGAYSSVPSCQCDSWGSYGKTGDAAIGEAQLTYSPLSTTARTSSVFMLKIAGYPTRAGRIEILQGGKTKRLRFNKDPRETWVERYIHVRAGEPFIVRIIDQSPTSWLAVSQPIPAGRLDPWVSALLGGYGTFLAIGIAAIGMLLLMWLRPASRGAEAGSPPGTIA